MHFLNHRMRRLIAGGLLPERAGQPVKALVHISLADLMVLEGSSALMREWTASVRAAWAAHRAATRPWRRHQRRQRHRPGRARRG